MNKTLIAIIVIILILGGGYFVWKNMGDREAVNDTAGSIEETNTESEASGGTFASVLRSGSNVECTFTQGEGPTTSSGQMYISNRGEEIRGDFTLAIDGEPQEAHMIRTGGWNYLWGSFSPQGIKMQVTEENREKIFEGESANIPDDVQYDCNSWNVDQSKFSVPSDVEFVDISAQIGTGADASVDMKSAQCAACEQAGPARAECRVALQCE